MGSNVQTNTNSSQLKNIKKCTLSYKSPLNFRSDYVYLIILPGDYNNCITQGLIT